MRAADEAEKLAHVTDAIAASSSAGGEGGAAMVLPAVDDALLAQVIDMGMGFSETRVRKVSRPSCSFFRSQSLRSCPVSM